MVAHFLACGSSSSLLVKLALGRPSLPAKDSMVPPKSTPQESLQKRPMAAAVIAEMPKLAPSKASMVEPTCVITMQSTALQRVCLQLRLGRLACGAARAGSLLAAALSGSAERAPTMRNSE
eukprot:CAMPEP_0176012398 /NCGR_PEP_ID=MMETSP0120_2-20121206/5776_1 /TAXON_ID=160619 /ORGANISM="Kryptoperidinium foliaceum, Strain CCMP 1326" /LENGTH=120 /DNA_ID=CAMNT_0017345285 /DNA_START=200 /DNA_END=559 /DNA_ORIENTATION=-